MIEHVLDHLRRLVAYDTSDPAAAITVDDGIIAYAADVLGAAGCAVNITDLGEGRVNLLAIRGTPTVLFNCHLDTVRPNPGWTRSPFELELSGGVATGLGACDIKGAGACLLAAAESTAEGTDAPLGVLFTTDEEGGKGACVGRFLADRAFDPSAVIVAEPTNCRAVAQHRGFASFEITFTGSAGHTSGAGATSRSATHDAVRWASAALGLAEPGGPLADERFNIGMIDGGSASNVVAAEARLRCGLRPSPGPDAVARSRAMLDTLKELLPQSAVWNDRFIAPSLTACPEAVAVAEAVGVEPGPDVDFWTEAALFAGGGLPAVVLGPGDIAQAHAADEFVELVQLERCTSLYRAIINAGGQMPEQTSSTPKGARGAP